MKVINQTRKTVLGSYVTVAHTFRGRLCGLLGRVGLESGEGLLLTPCQSVHSIGMRFSCEALYLDKENRIIHIHTLNPYRFGPLKLGSRSVLELPLGTVSYSHTQLGDLLVVQEHKEPSANTM